MIRCIGFQIVDKLQKNCPVKFNCKLHKSASNGDIKLQPVDPINEKGCRKFEPVHRKGLGEK